MAGASPPMTMLKCERYGLSKLPEQLVAAGDLDLAG